MSAATGSCQTSRPSRGSYRPLILQPGPPEISSCSITSADWQLATVFTPRAKCSRHKGFACSRECSITACKAAHRQTQGWSSQAAPSSTDQGLQLSPPAAPHHTTSSRWFGEQHSQGNSRTAGAVPPEGSSYHTLASEAAASLEASHRHLSHCAGLETSSQDCLAIRLLYLTGWEEPVIHYSAQGADWQTACLTRVTSGGGQLSETLIELQSAHLPDGSSSAPSAASTSTLEFVITDGFDNWDKPASGGNYSLTGCGTFVLQDGDVQAVPGRRCLVVSDLDDTLVGDDAGTYAFRQFWEQDAVLRGSRLVFNTGRALDSFLILQAQKADCLPTPDLLIAAVGTKIYSCRAGSDWAEDSDFTAKLDEGWDLNVVREACYQVVMSVGREAMHFRPPEEQNDHKVTCGVLATQAAVVQNRIQSALDQHAVTAKLVFSGKGDWRYLDIVSQNAGKAEALNFVMEKMGFSRDNTIACGDSGNDRDMLAAANLAIVVGNAQPDLKQWLATLTQTQTHHQGRLRLAQAKAHHACGILEGLEQLGFACA